MLCEVGQRLRVADRLAGCIEDPRAPDQITHTLAAIIARHAGGGTRLRTVLRRRSTVRSSAHAARPVDRNLRRHQILAAGHE